MGPTPSILLIDDNEQVLSDLEESLSRLLPSSSAQIRKWMPTSQQDDPESHFASLIDASTALVVTDYDLTNKGLRGLFGTAIVGWCQRQAIPVGNFSRAITKNLPREPNLFELRVPPTNDEAARYIANAFNGFRTIEKAIQEAPALHTKPTLATVLAAVLKREHLDSQLALYMLRLGAANSSLIERLRELAGPQQPSFQERTRTVTYVLGHVLLNAILRFPGPILSKRALAAYVATSDVEAEALGGLFKSGIYQGPFSDDDAYYWREDVDVVLEQRAAQGEKLNIDDIGDYNRAVVEAALGRPLASHVCPRDGCGGRRGGFLCPFTFRTVCTRVDCSIAASGWIPQGAQLSRVEREFYDEWAPLLGY
jgi:hypothetical protein